MFAGIGGFRSGLSKFGDFFVPVGFCEIDPYARKAYEAIYDTKGELFFEDARKIVPEELPDIDLICGGFPCQSFSIAGKRGGFEDARGTLFFEIARIARVKRPKYLLLENVPGLLSHDGGRTFATILNALSELGYNVAWHVLNSANFGVPQARKRVFLICYLGEECPGEILSFTDANPKTIVQKLGGRQGDRVYDQDGLSCTLTSNGGGFAGNTGLYSVGQLPIKSLTKSGYQIAEPGDSIDLAYPNLNTRRGRVGKQIAHTITPNITQGVYFIDMNPEPKITELARCITARQDAGISNRKGEHSGVLERAEEGPRAVLTPDRESIRQQGRRMKDPEEPMLAYISMHKQGWEQHSYVALCSTADRAALQMLKDNPHLKTIYLCLDNDSAGQIGCQRVAESIHALGNYTIWRLKPQNKDWDEDLKVLHGREAIPKQMNKTQPSVAMTM